MSPIKQRTTIISNNEVEKNNVDDLHLSRARWVLPKGEYQRQDRFIIPLDVLASHLLSSSDNGKAASESAASEEGVFESLSHIDEFSVQWSAFNNTIISKQLELKNRRLKNINNVFSKHIEPGYSVFVKPANKSSSAFSSSLSQLVSFFNQNNLNEYGIAENNFIKTPVSLNYFNNNIHQTENFPESAKQFLSNIICSAESTSEYTREENPKITLQANCKSNYNQLLSKLSSASIDYSKSSKEVTVTLQWNSGTLQDISSVVYKADPKKIMKELGIFEIQPGASQVNDIDLYGLSADLPSTLPVKKDLEDENAPSGQITHEDQDTRVAKKMMFYLSPRHISFSEENQLIFNSSFKQPWGLHPEHLVSIKTDEHNIIQRNITSNKLSIEPPMNKEIFDCELYSYYRLPHELFLDKNEYSGATRGSPLQILGVWGETDLEKPSYSADKWGSNVLVRVNVETHGSDHDDPKGELLPTAPYENLYALKLHSRYQPVIADSSGDSVSSYAAASIPKPDLFWACELNKHGIHQSFADGKIKKSKMEDVEASFSEDLVRRNPLSSKSGLNSEALFTDNTVFYHWTLDYGEETQFPSEAFQDKFDVPRGRGSDFFSVQVFTLVAVLLSLVYLGKKVLNGYNSKLIIGAERKEKVGKETKEERKVQVDMGKSSGVKTTVEEKRFD